MKLVLATLLLPSLASLPYTTARVGPKTLKLNRHLGQEGSIHDGNMKQLERSLQDLNTTTPFAADIAMPVHLQGMMKKTSGDSSRHLVECSNQSNGQLTCQADYGGGFTGIFFDCPASASAVSECASCTMIAPDNVSPCNSCSICSDTVAFDCSNIFVDACAIQDCTGNCINSDPSFPSPTPPTSSESPVEVPRVEDSHNDMPSTGLIVGLVAVGIAAMGFVAFFLKGRTNSKPQVPPHLGTENDSVLDIYTEDGAKKGPVKVPGKPLSMVNESVFERVDSLREISLNGRGNADEESVYDTSFSSIASGHSYPATEWSLPPALAADSQSQITNDDEASIHEFEIRAPAGMLGIVLDTPNGGVLNVKEIKSNSPLVGRVRVGDRLVAVDGKNVTYGSVEDVARLIASKKHNPARKLIFARPGK